MAVAGTYAGAGLASIDAKGRMTLPSDIRDTLFAASGERTVVVSMHESLDCLVGFGENEQALKLDDIQTEWKSTLGQGAGDFNREAASAAGYGLNFKANCEASGRFVLNPDLREMAMIEDRAFIYGAGRHFCIWNPTEFLGADLGPEYKRLTRFLELQLKKEGAR